MEHPKSKRIGITGGIGTGKTTACRIFESLGIPVYYADDRAKWLMSNDENLRTQIIENFGSESYLPDGSLHRAHLSKVVFSDPDLLQLLNSLVHPAVFSDGEAWHHAQKNVPYTLKEAALLIESGSSVALDALIVVTAPEPLRIARVMQRDSVGEAAVRARIANQLPEEEKIKQAHFIIQNDGQQLLLPQVMAIHRQLLA